MTCLLFVLQGSRPEGIGYGVGIAFGLFAMLEVSSIVSYIYDIRLSGTNISSTR
jgi:hypothetical protein